MNRSRWYRPLFAGCTVWALLQGCGSDGGGSTPGDADGGEATGPGPDAGAGNEGSPGGTAGTGGKGNEPSAGDAGMSAAGEDQGGAPVSPSTSHVWVGAAVGTGQGASYHVRIRLGGPQSGRGDGVAVSVKVGRP